MQGIFHLEEMKGLERIASLANREALLELTAGGIDIVAARITNSRLHSMHSESTLKSFDFLDGRRLERAIGDVVQLDEVHVAQRTLAEIDERLHLGIGVVDAIDHGELVRRTTPGILRVILQRLVKAKQGVLLHTGHQLVARGLNGGVQGDGEGELLVDLAEAIDAGDDAAC